MGIHSRQPLTWRMWAQRSSSGVRCLRPSAAGQDLAEALDCDAFDLLSVYPGKNGGFTHSLEMARTAQAAGKACVIGSNLETDLGQAAMVCLPASLTAFPVEQYACDLMSSLFYQKSSTNPPILLRDGRVATPQGMGFGVEPANESTRDH